MTLAASKEAGRPAPGDPAPESTTPRKHRGDIQGLRALAVLLVVLNHAGVSQLSGGYVGVDIFFVVSGFVITGSLRGREHQQGISLPAFYAARARRILPMATVVLVATVLASWKWLNFVRAGRTVTDAVWAGFFAANFHFSAIGTDYFSADLPPSPLQHYWSLAVEEQFYLIWPLLLGLLLFGFRRRARRATPGRAATRRVVVALALVMAASLLWSVKQTGYSPTAAFFSPFTRAWELGIGALLMIGSTAITRVPVVIRASLSWVGLLGAVAAGVLFTARTPFPGYAALLPVLSTAAVIAGGTGGTTGGAGALLSLRPLRAIGDWSYSFYLWHWPILIVATGYLEHDPRLRIKLALVGFALVLSYASYRLIETPFRRAPRLKRSRRLSLALWPVAVGVLLVTCLWATSALQSIPPAAAGTTQTVTADTPPTVAVSRAVAAGLAGDPIPANLSPPVDKIGGEYGALRPGCYAQAGNTTNKICKYGDTNAKRSIVLMGDSHAHMWLPALDALGKKNGWLVYPMLKLRCPWINVSSFRLDTGYDRECDTWRRWALKTAAELHPQRVILSSTFEYYKIGNVDGGPLKDAKDKSSIPVWMAGMADTVQTFKNVGAKVTIFTDAPGVKALPQECLLRRNATMATCMSPLNTKRLGRTIAREGARATGSDLLDVEPWFCAHNLCPTVIGGIIAYRDTAHVGATYARYLGTAMAIELKISR